MNEFKICKDVYNAEHDSNAEPTYNIEIDGTRYSGLSLEEAVAIAENSNIYNSENCNTTVCTQEPKTIKLREYSVDICELFEDLLEEHDISIPDEDREGRPEEARLYGTTYADLEYKVLNILNEFMNDLIEHPDANIDIINL